jgi:predicted nucleotidyltransferase
MTKVSADQMAEMFAITEEKVEKVIQSLILTYNPIFIYSFGSYARGTTNEDSDFDVMVVIDEFDDKPWVVTSRAYEGLWGIKMPIDLTVYDKKKFEECKEDKATFCYSILKKGKLLYERKGK